MKVAICDDNLIFLEELKLRLEKNQLITAVFSFSSPLELVMRIQDEEKYDLVFMDIDWGAEEKQNGFQWGEEISKLLPDVSIIFITGYNDRFAQHVLLSEANILGYMTKPVDNNILERYLKKAKENTKDPKYLVISRHSGKISIPLDEIIFIESHNHKAIIHTETTEYEVYEKLIDLQNRLLKTFISCHKSYIINMDWVSTYEGKTFRMRNDREISISRAYSAKAKEAFFRYLGEGL